EARRRLLLARLRPHAAGDDELRRRPGLRLDARARARPRHARRAHGRRPAPPLHRDLDGRGRDGLELQPGPGQASPALALPRARPAPRRPQRGLRQLPPLPLHHADARALRARRPRRRRARRGPDRRVAREPDARPVPGGLRRAHHGRRPRRHHLGGARPAVRTVLYVPVRRRHRGSRGARRGRLRGRARRGRPRARLPARGQLAAARGGPEAGGRRPHDARADRAGVRGARGARRGARAPGRDVTGARPARGPATPGAAAARRPALPVLATAVRNGAALARNALLGAWPGPRPRWVVLELTGAYPERTPPRRLVSLESLAAGRRDASLAELAATVDALCRADWLEGALL